MAVPDASFAPAQANLATPFVAPQVASAPSPGQGLALNETGAIPSGLAAPPAITGQVSSVGAITAGTFFSVSHTGTGAYTITFDTPFAAAPTVMLSVQAAAGAFRAGAIVTASVSTTGFQVVTNTIGGGVTDVPFQFVAFATV